MIALPSARTPLGRDLCPPGDWRGGKPREGKDAEFGEEKVVFFFFPGPIAEGTEAVNGQNVTGSRSVVLSEYLCGGEATPCESCLCHAVSAGDKAASCPHGLLAYGRPYMQASIVRPSAV